MHPSPLDLHLGYWLRLVSNQVSHTFALAVEHEGVTVAEWVVLRELYDVDELAPSVLAERIGLSRGGVSKLAERLLAKALVRRDPDPIDRRAHHLSLTPEARALVPRLAALADANDAAFFDHLPPEDRQSLRRILEGIVHQHGLTTRPVD